MYGSQGLAENFCQLSSVVAECRTSNRSLLLENKNEAELSRI